MKAMISFGILIFSTLGGWIGQLMDHGNWLGGWSIILSVIGAFAGIWIGYIVAQYWGL